MSDDAPFVLGSFVFVCADGPELLVYQAPDGHPLWKTMVGAPIVGVGVHGERVLAADADGRLRVFGSLDGRVLEEVDFPGAVSGLAVDPASGTVAARLAAEVVVRPGSGGERRIPFASPRAIAIGPQGGSLGIGNEAGEFYAVDPGSGVAWGKVELGAPVDAIAWCNQGFWLVAAGPTVHRVAPDGRSVLGAIVVADRVIALATSADGMLAAWVTSPRAVAIFEMKAGERLGGVLYRTRDVEALCFADAGVLGVGLDDGDANRLDLMSNALTRTGQHRGRAFAQWAVKVDLEPGRVRGALVRAKAGGAAIAAQVSHDPDIEIGEDGKPRKKKSCLVSCLTTAAIALAIMFVCAGCSGVGYALWHKVYYG